MARKREERVPAKLNLRMPEALQMKIEKDADKRGLSMNAAIISRLEVSFRREQRLAEAMDSVLGGTRAAAAFQTLASLAKRVETQTGTSWTEDYGTFVAVKRLWDRVFPLLAPTPSKELQEKMAEVSPDKWPKEPEPLTLQEDLTGSNKPDYSRGFLGALLGREQAEPQPPEEAAARAETERNVAAWAEYQREIQPLRSKLQQLGDHFRLLEDIGEGVAKDAVPELRRRRSKED